MNERSIFAAALEIADPEHRSTYLHDACGDDVDLRRSVEELLRADAAAGSFMDTPAATLDTAHPGDAPADQPALDFLDASDRPGSLGRLGSYEIMRLVGCGGMGIVLEGRDTRLDRVVAIKVLAPQLATSASARQRFLREAKAAAAVRDEHVVTIYAVDEASGLPYLVMELIAGMSLQERLDRDGPLELNEILRIGMQTARGLAAAHAHGLVHRDVKPANILLENGVERVKLTDFGLARVVDDASLTQSGLIAGTPQFMSPEQARGDTVDHRADLFSLGSVLYAMCTGRPPYRASTTLGVLKRVCEEPLGPIREINPNIPDWLVALIETLHAKNPNERYQTAAEVAENLSQQLARLQQPSLRAPEPTIVSQSAVRNPHSAIATRPWAIAAAALVLLVLGISLTEATGVTHVVPTVIRIVTGEGTLVVETDPDVQVTMEGNGDLTFQLAGGQSIRVPTGNYRVKATKEGKPIPLDKELVSIARGGNQVVRVRLEREPPIAAAPKTGQGAFVLLAAGMERKFDTLAEAVLGSTDGDTIEVRGNGPFVSDPIKIQGRALTIRAGEGFRPVIKLNPNLQTDSALVLEGLELQRVSNAASKGYEESLVFSIGHPSPLHVANCRFRVDVDGLVCIYGDYERCVIRNCELLNRTDFAVCWDGKQCVMENCLQIGQRAALIKQFLDGRQDISVQFTRSTLVSPETGGVVLNLDPRKIRAEKELKPVRVDASATIFDTNSVFFMNQDFAADETPLPLQEAEVLLRSVLTWRDRLNLFAPGSSRVLIYTHPPERATVGPKDLAEWRQLWGTPDNDAVEGRIRYQGGDLLAKLRASPEKLTPEDFRLRADSPGYRASPDWKDLGADVDLVGPGPAYERWRKTPEYQEWLKDSGQLKDRAAAKPDTGAFVLLGGKGVAARKFDTLAEAVASSSDGDTIEVRGNGPFVSEPIRITTKSLIIRAGNGFLPVITLREQDVERKDGLIETLGSLVLEGLDLRRTTLDKGAQWTVWHANFPLHAANCRFQSGGIYAGRSGACTFRNCEIITDGRASIGGEYRPGARVVFDNNCLLATMRGANIGLLFRDPELNDVAFQFTQNTCVNRSHFINLSLHVPVSAADGQSSFPPSIRWDVSNCIFDAPWMLRFDQTREFLDKAPVLQGAEGDAALARLFHWGGRRNVFAPRSTAVTWAVDKVQQPPRDDKSEAWEKLSAKAETDGLQGRPRFQGGDLGSRKGADLDQLTPEEFRLRPDSAGYRAGTDGKDLGADVDLVGPGAAYERWKKTPEYEEWLKETGQQK